MQADLALSLLRILFAELRSNKTVLMIIYKFNIKRVAVFPNKTNSPPVIDSNTILFPALTAQFLKMIGRRDAQILQRVCGIQHR